MKLELRGDIIDTEMIVYVKHLRKPIENREPGQAELTHVIYFKSEYITHDSMRKGLFINQEEFSQVHRACFEMIEETT